MAKCIVIGGTGFIGCNTAYRFMQQGYEVVAVDNLSRKGGAANLAWLQSHGPLTFVRADIRDAEAMTRLFNQHGDADTVMHLAGQVAVTSSVKNPREDFEINALGTMNILEAIRASGRAPLLMYASTNKVYGGMDDIAIEKHASRYAYCDYPMGISEAIPLDFHSPYGCSKGAADQYIHDYARIYGLPTVVFRQSCIYGYRQFGVEDQGWVAWFVIAALLGREITICGDGKQVRDVLFIDDLTNLYLAAARQPEKVVGKIFNIGGGPEYTMSIWAEFGPLLEELIGKRIPVTYSDWRPGDQPVYISDIRKIDRELGWKPTTSVRDGVTKLVEWVRANQNLFE